MGYAPASNLLKEAGIRYSWSTRKGFCRDAAPSTDLRALYCPNGVAASGPNRVLEQVWRAEGYTGYPYREFYRDVGFDLDLTTSAIHPAATFHHYRIKYTRHRETPHKRPYGRRRATLRRACRKFMHNRERRSSTWLESSARSDVVSPYDAELLGHGVRGPSSRLPFRKLH